jgi:glycosyltransferase involved in cell wall biosynthesis
MSLVEHPCRNSGAGARQRSEGCDHVLISVIIPVYNERATIQEIVRRVQEQAYEKELIIVDDASTDGTREVLATSAWADNVHLYYHERNRGKGAAIRTGIEHLQGDIVII